jgi:hypothetical protein
MHSVDIVQALSTIREDRPEYRAALHELKERLSMDNTAESSMSQQS